MGSCCVPQVIVEPLELNQRIGKKQLYVSFKPLPKEVANNVIKTQEDHHTPQEMQDVDENKIDLNLRSYSKKLSNTSVMGQSLGYSVYSKLYRQEFQQILIAPSSARITILDRMENENFPPQEVFVKYPAGSLINITRKSADHKTVKGFANIIQADSAIF